MASWFSSLAEQALKLADDLADSIVAQANEAQAQLQQEQQKIKAEENERQETLNSTFAMLPWETNVEARQILSQDLMEKILALSLNDGNFTSCPPNSGEVYFSFKDFVPVAMKLLEIDTNLARMHAKLSPKMNEEDLWFNYYCRIIYLRAASGIDGADAQNTVRKWKEIDILSIPTPSTSSSNNSNVPVGAAVVTPQTPPTTTRPHIGPADTSLDTVQIITPTKLSPIVANAQSVQKMGSVTDDLALDDMDDLELEEQMKDLDILDALDDIDPDEYENIDADELNDELEAQIALELAQDDS